MNGTWQCLCVWFFTCADSKKPSHQKKPMDRFSDRVDLICPSACVHTLRNVSLQMQLNGDLLPFIRKKKHELLTQGEVHQLASCRFPKNAFETIDSRTGDVSAACEVHVPEETVSGDSSDLWWMRLPTFLRIAPNTMPETKVFAANLVSAPPRRVTCAYQCPCCLHCVL